MTPAQLAETLAAIGWSRREFARRIGLTEAAVRQWQRVPAHVASWLRRLAAVAGDAPPLR